MVNRAGAGWHCARRRRIVRQPPRGVVMSAGAIGRIVAVSLLATASVPWLRPALAEPLMIIDTKAPDLNCLFNQACKITVTDSVGAIPIAGLSGRAILQSRTFYGIAGTPAAGLTGYLFRIDLTRAMAGPAKACVTRLTLDHAALSKLAYPGGAGPGEVFVVTAGGIGTVGLVSAGRAGGAGGAGTVRAGRAAAGLVDGSQSARGRRVHEPCRRGTGMWRRRRRRRRDQLFFR